jgi:hypothetical protein
MMAGISPPAVVDVLRDGRTYADWVVGTRKIRAVDPGWPAEGTALHYTVGYGPLRKDGHTRSLAYEPDHRLELEAHAWPAGTARIELRAEPVQGGTLVSIDEHPLRGVGARLHNPVADLVILLRNVETLRRLERCIRVHRLRD